MENEIKDYLILFIDEFGDRAIEKMADKQPKIDFKVLNRYAIQKIKQLKPELF